MLGILKSQHVVSLCKRKVPSNKPSIARHQDKRRETARMNKVLLFYLIIKSSFDSEYSCCVQMYSLLRPF